ncbi:MAG: hypothetical protein ACTHMM_23195 [Agriterribacter sp.]
MNNCDVVSWQDEPVYTLTNIVSDMWYLSADCQPIYGNNHLKFKEIASKLDGKNVINDFAKGMVAVLTYSEAPGNSHYVLILSLEESMIFMRMLTNEMAVLLDSDKLRRQN